MKIQIFLFLFITLCTQSCEKDKIEFLPNAHNSDSREVFGCLVNGKVWTPKSKGILSPLRNASSNGDLYIIAERFDEPISNMEMGIAKVNGTGKHPIDFAFFEGFECDYEYFPDSTNQNPFNFIEIDSIGIVKIGTFQFMAIDTLCKDTVIITEGRFKI